MHDAARDRDKETRTNEEREMATDKIERTIECLDEATSRSQWHQACAEFGIENCRVELVEVDGGSSIYKITIRK